MTIGTTIVGSTLFFVLQAYLIVLIARIVVDYVFIFARDWRPSGPVLVLVELIYTVTDPPIKLLQRVIPSIRVGMFDFQLTVVFLILFILIRILSGIVLMF
ncbi:YggT family protein [Longivirga aurantiaca]|uniref:YggT family protein n=1 Tax=Longivirga aurantiaca TaxID=1837743 RepID=A0ABW1T342_9ACTN